LLQHGGLKALAFLRQHVQEHRAALRLEKFEGLDQRGDVVAVDGAVVFQAEFFENHARPQDALGSFLGFARHMQGGFSAKAFDELLGALVQVVEARVGDDFIEIAGDGADVLVDRPLVIVEHDDQPPGAVGDVIEGFVGDATGEGGVSGEGDDVFFPADAIARDCHTERGGESRAGVTGAIAVVRALAAQHEAIESARSADGVELLAASGEELVDVRLVADVEDEMIRRRIENVVHGQREFDHAQVRTEVSAGFREDGNQLLANLFGKNFKLGASERFDIEWGMDGIE